MLADNANFSLLVKIGIKSACLLFKKKLQKYFIAVSFFATLYAIYINIIYIILMLNLKEKSYV